MNLTEMITGLGAKRAETEARLSELDTALSKAERTAEAQRQAKIDAVRRRHLVELEGTDHAALVATARAALAASLTDPGAELDPVRAAFALSVALRREQQAEHDIADLRGSFGMPHAEPANRRVPGVLDLLAAAADEAARGVIKAEAAARTDEVNAAQRDEELPEPRWLDPATHNYLQDQEQRTARDVATLTERLRYALDTTAPRTAVEQAQRERIIISTRAELEEARRQAARAEERLTAFRAGQPID